MTFDVTLLNNVAGHRQTVVRIEARTIQEMKRIVASDYIGWYISSYAYTTDK